ncbi:MAG: ketoacyl-ACP synthase III [Acidobacteriota bacterium]|nr:ketoacyl-ACP synthase III [Acidobacteriota bacterium]MDE3030403.1 ketoacyl-ACP synthase III [Acidobacteriota bacterium]MDE3092743.1 ketoacyl-ACP synthase III [Acidobacteriota bacterium]MDE3145905.1 ketoacyl-ACP synthase III [Acidobacteriota bacterium]
MGVRFKGWGIGLPDRIVTNDELSLTLDTSDEWISERTGIRQRYIGGTARSLGAVAGRNAMADAGVEPEDIDFVLLATTSPDRMAPATSALIADDLGLTCPAMDVNAACSGFMYAVRTAQGLLETGNKRILVIGAEHLSRWVDWTDRNIAVLLADGGGAAVLEYDPDVNDIVSFALGADGSGADLLTCEHESTFTMDGREVFRRAVRVVVESSQQAIERAGITADDLALVIPHQANVRIIQAVVDRLGIGMDRAVIALDRYGNTSSASIPLAYDVARQEGRIKTGDYALLTGFGAGMTWASSVIRWS